MSDKFLPLNDTDKAALLAKASDILPNGYKDLKFATVLETTLPFYPDWTFIQIQKDGDLSAPPLSLFYKGEDVVPLDWQPATILAFNQRAPLSLSIHDIAGYVLFFFSHSRVRDGQMQIIESYDDFSWREEPVVSVKKALSSLIRAPHLISWDEQNQAYEVGAHILFNRNLFECRLHVNANGEITVSERTLQVEDMPILDDIAA